jgi:hypothetical protein
MTELPIEALGDTKAEKEKLCELSDKLRKLRARCSQYCSVWNCEDRDCEIYGEQHPSPARCRYFLECELERRNIK